MQQEEISIFPEITVTYATFGQRLGAYLIDFLVLLLPAIIIVLVFGNTSIIGDLYKYHEIRVAATYHDLISTLIGWLYYSSMESSRAQATIGKQALGLKVTDLHGERISFARATGRHFSQWLSAIILFFGYFMVLWDSRNQALHDKIAGTLVVKKSVQLQREM